jgi:hypothetical protein
MVTDLLDQRPYAVDGSRLAQSVELRSDPVKELVRLPEPTTRPKTCSSRNR